MGTSVVRLFRVLRIMRLFSAVKLLSKLDHVVVHATKEMFHFGMVVILSLYVFAVLATNLMWDDKDEEIAEMFKNLGSSLWSLFKLMTMDGWSVWADKIIEDRPSMVVFFGVFIFLSIASAIFIEAHFTEVEIEKEKRQRERSSWIQDMEDEMLRQVFQAMDKANRHSGFLTIAEINEALRSELLEQWFYAEEVGVIDDLEDIKLGIFAEWEATEARDGSGGSENSEAIKMLDEDSFVYSVFHARNAKSTRPMWRTLTKIRQEAKEVANSHAQRCHDLEAFMGAKFADLRHQLEVGFSSASIESRAVAQAVEAQVAAHQAESLGNKLAARAAVEAAEKAAARALELENSCSAALAELRSARCDFDQAKCSMVTELSTLAFAHMAAAAAAPAIKDPWQPGQPLAEPSVYTGHFAAKVLEPHGLQPLAFAHPVPLEAKLAGAKPTSAQPQGQLDAASATAAAATAAQTSFESPVAVTHPPPLQPEGRLDATSVAAAGTAAAEDLARTEGAVAFGGGGAVAVMSANGEVPLEESLPSKPVLLAPDPSPSTAGNPRPVEAVAAAAAASASSDAPQALLPVDVADAGGKCEVTDGLPGSSVILPAPAVGEAREAGP